MLRLVLPKGSLERATFELFESADLSVVRSSAVDYKASIDDPRVDEVRILRPQEIAGYVEEGLFDLGITGRDWVEETGATVESLGELQYSKATSNPVRVVVAVAGDSDIESVADLPDGVRVTSEYPEMTRRFFAERGVDEETLEGVKSIFSEAEASRFAGGGAGADAGGLKTRVHDTAKALERFL